MPKASWGAIEGSPFEDELEEYAVYEGEMPPKGVYRLRLKMLRLKENVNGDKMLSGLVIVNEPSGSKKAQYNGYDTWFNLNITKQGARWVNNFLSALFPENKVAAIRKAFWGQKVMIDKEEPPNIISIGGVKITENMLISALLVWDSYGEGAMKPKSFSRPTDMTLNEDDLDGPTDEDEEWEDSGAEPDEDEDEDEGDEEADPEFDARAEELEAMDRKALLAAAKAAGIATTRGMKSDAIIDLILEEEFPPEDEESEEDEPEDDEEPDEDEEIAEDEDDEEEPEEEPEPPKRTRRTRAAAAKPEPAKPAARSRKAPAKTAEPERAKTGTRRRRSGQPPF